MTSVETGADTTAVVTAPKVDRPHAFGDALEGDSPGVTVPRPTGSAP